MQTQLFLLSGERTRKKKNGRGEGRKEDIRSWEGGRGVYSKAVHTGKNRTGTIA